MRMNVLWLRTICRLTAVASAAWLGGCFGTSVPATSDDGGFGAGHDLAPLCSGNNDGMIERTELQFPLGLTVNYLVNPPGTTVTVDPDGQMEPDGRHWDLTSSQGSALPLSLSPVAGQWFAPSFPGATYYTVSDIGSGTLGIFKVTDDALQILGFASPEPNKTLLVYSTPIDSLRFPIRLGDGYVSTGTIVNGTLNGMPFASTDTYRVSVDALGTAVLPFLTFQNTLRVHVELSQALPGGVAITHIQYLFFHECYGELGRMVSNPGETNTSFNTAAEFRRLAL
jgi:hypothetical protein